MKILLAFASLLIALAPVSKVHAQKEAEIVSRFRKALMRGAEDVTTEPPVIMRGKITSQGMLLDGVIYYSKPNNRMELSTAGMTQISFQNDTIRWTHNSANNHHSIEKVSTEQSASERARELKFDFASKDLLLYKQRGFKLKSFGVKKSDSIECYALQLIKPDQAVIDFFIDTRTNLIYRIQSGNDYRVYANYQRHGEYMYPSFMSTEIDKLQMEMVMSEVVVPADISPSLFKIPAEAYAYVDKFKAQLEAMIVSADSLYRRKEYAKAIAEYSSILSRYGGVYRAYNGRGLCKLAERKYYEAVSDFNEALAIVPTGSYALNNRGLAKYYIGDGKGAMEDYNAAINADSLLADGYRNRGLLYFDQKKFDEAAKDYQVVIRLAPSDPSSFYRYAVSIAQAQRDKEALQFYKKAISMGLNTAAIYNYTGVSYFKIEAYDSAAEMFRSALLRDKEELQYIYNYGNSLYRLAKYEEATNQFDRYIAIKSDNPEVYNLIGLCKYNDGDFKGAIQKFSKAIEMSPKTAVYFDNRASAREQLEDYEGAISDLSQSITLYPTDPQVFYKRGILKITTSKKLEGCMDLGTANEMKYEDAKEAIMKHCN